MNRVNGLMMRTKVKDTVSKMSRTELIQEVTGYMSPVIRPGDAVVE